MRAAVKELRKQLRGSDPARIERIKKQIDFLNERVRKGLKLPEPRVINKGSEEVQSLELKRDLLRSEINQRIQDLKPRTTFNKFIGDPADLLRALKAGTDLSFFLRQGGFIGISSPKEVRAATEAMWKALISEKGAAQMQKQVLTGMSNSVNYKQAGLKFDGLDTGITTKAAEELASTLLGRIARSGKVGKLATLPTRRTGAAFVVYLNTLRAKKFDAMYLALAKKGTPTEDEMRLIANFVNIATGSGNLRKLESSASLLSRVFFAPKYVASRFQLMFGTPIFKELFKKGASRRAQALIAKEYAKTLTGTAIVFESIHQAKKAYDKDGVVSIETDPRSSDGGKIKIGNTRIDLLAGLAQTFTISARVLPSVPAIVTRTITDLTPLENNLPEWFVEPKAKSVSTGKLKPTIRPGFGKTSLAGITGRFVRTKFAPLFSIPVDLAFQENVVGEEITVTGIGEDVKSAFDPTPMALGDIYEAMTDDGLDSGTALVMTLKLAQSALIFAGAGGQTFDAKRKRNKKKKR